MVFASWSDRYLFISNDQEITALDYGEVFIIFVDVLRRGSIGTAFPKGHLASIGSIEDVALYAWAELKFCADEIRRVFHEIGEFVHAAFSVIETLRIPALTDGNYALGGCLFAAPAFFFAHTAFIFRLNAFFSAVLFGLRFDFFAACSFFAAQISFNLRLRALRSARVFDLRFGAVAATGFTFLAALYPVTFNSALMLSISDSMAAFCLSSVSTASSISLFRSIYSFPGQVECFCFMKSRLSQYQELGQARS
jgi:hypothetical protein